MDGCRLEPWMLAADWRGDKRPLAIVDLAEWPADRPLAPLPPVPVLATGPADHPQASRADILVEPACPLPTLVAGISRTPLTAATLVELLRAIEGLPPERALPLESFAMAMLQGGAEHAVWRARQPQRPVLPPGKLDLDRDGSALNLAIDRPAARNAIDRSMRDELHDAFSLALLDPGIGTIRLRARGRAFGVGADLAEFGAARDPAQAHAIRARTLPALPLARFTGTFEVHVQGACIGASLELAAFADTITASPDSWFQLPETGMGIVPGFGGCVSIPARIGRQRAAALMLSGRRIGAATARDWGLVDRIVDDAPLDQCHPHRDVTQRAARL